MLPLLVDAAFLLVACIAMYLIRYSIQTQQTHCCAVFIEPKMCAHVCMKWMATRSERTTWAYMSIVAPVKCDDEIVCRLMYRLVNGKHWQKMISFYFLFYEMMKRITRKCSVCFHRLSVSIQQKRCIFQRIQTVQTVYCIFTVCEMRNLTQFDWIFYVLSGFWPTTTKKKKILCNVRVMCVCMNFTCHCSLVFDFMSSSP